MAYALLKCLPSAHMIDGLFNQTNYVAAKKMMDATMARHEAIASNLANVETPGYKRLDLSPDFAAQLRRAMGTGNYKNVDALRPALAVDTSAVSNSRDGNSVQLENELAEMNKNTLQHTLDTRLVTGTLLKLRLAILGRPI